MLRGLIVKEPRSPALPVLWRYDEIRPFIMEAGTLITAKEAERRVLVLENPGLRGKSRITQSLYAGLQLILPGEVAPAHRHTQSALRFVVEGTGAYTAVDGERTIMEPGDFVITPSWTWHDHGNDSEEPMVWIDGLDIPIVAVFDAQFAEDDPQRDPAGDAARGRFARALRQRPAAGRLRARRCRPRPSSTIPTRARASRSEQMRKAEAWDPCHGLKLRYINPVDGGWAMPTIGTFMQLLPKGFATAPYRSTDATVFSRRRRQRPDGHHRPRRRQDHLRLGPARHVRGAELAVAHHETDERRGALQLLRPPGAGQARPVARDARQPGQRQGRVSAAGLRVVQTDAPRRRRGVRR